jgi:hypothetical protein
VVAQVEHALETGCRVVWLVPQAIRGALALEQPVDAALDRRRVYPACRQCLGRIARYPQHVEHQHRIDHRGKDAAQPVFAVQARQACAALPGEMASTQKSQRITAARG